MSKKYSNIDDLFRDKLKDFEADPPEHIWEKVQEKMPNKPGKGAGNPFRKGGIAGTAMILILTGIISFSLMNDPVDSDDPDLEVVQENILFADHQNNQMIESVVRGVDPPQKKKKEKHRKKQGKHVKAGNSSKNATLYVQPVTTGPVPSSLRAHQSMMVKPLQAYGVGLAKRPPTSPATIGQRNPNIHNDRASISTPTGTDEIFRFDPANESSENSSVSGYKTLNRWSLGLFYTPEMILYPSDDQMKNYSQSLDVLVSYKPGNYFLQTGIGLAQYRDQGNQIINYNTYLGSYEDVYNVTFDSTAGAVTPIYHTETVHVYDSVTHVTIIPSKRNFTYLQIPLMIGYGEMYKRFGWSVKCGPSVSILLHEKDPGQENTMMQARILGIENELPGRIQTNWQFVLSAGLTYKLGNTINLNIEPLFRYYIRSAYENNTLNTRHPWSAGLRTGVSFDF